ncbi:hypothetical protein GCM10022281_07970 [Sphingomonas rosea]|uniref:Nickel/cobalt transporter regulator n=1 Tax=Sphingomonas rosea TaxID=335605 RepID=A0ABP7TT84_9SPHN
MRKISIFAGVAALALTGPAIAQGKGNGGGGGPKGGGGPPAAHGGGPGGGQGGGGPKMDRGGGGPQKQMNRGGGGPQRMERGNGGGQAMRMERGPARQMQQQERRAERPQMRGPERGPKMERGPVREARVEQPRGGRPERIEQRGNGRVMQAPALRQADYRGPDRREVRFGDSRNWVSNPQVFQSVRTTGLVDGCPPGLAAKNNGCLPPGQARKLVGAIAPAVLGAAVLPPLYSSWYPDNDDYWYREDNGYVYRIDRDRNYVDAYWPLANDWTGAYYVGAAYPQDYLGYYNVPVQYQPWYADNGDDYYRYGDGAIYSVDRGSGVIDGIVSLLAGGFGIGQPMPAGYDVYNVPYAYRDRYVDGPDSMYRYNDGYIYQVDPTTQIVQAIVERLV